MLTFDILSATTLAVPILETAALTVGYESLRLTLDGNLRGVFGFGRRYFPVLTALSCHVAFTDSVVTVVGANGAGKTTLLRAIAGVVPSSGTIAWAGQAIHSLSQHQRLAAGIAFVPYQHGLFPSLTIGEHLRLVEPRQGARTAVLDELRKL